MGSKIYFQMNEEDRKILKENSSLSLDIFWKKPLDIRSFDQSGDSQC
jgi:hypothetical protein